MTSLFWLSIFVIFNFVFYCFYFIFWHFPSSSSTSSKKKQIICECCHLMVPTKSAFNFWHKCWWQAKAFVQSEWNLVIRCVRLEALCRPISVWNQEQFKSIRSSLLSNCSFDKTLNMIFPLAFPLLQKIRYALLKIKLANSWHYISVVILS